ncbi:MAG TPA: cytochrome c3 family protein [Tepidisphaeraceae bacterium]|jgi:hypothetical protein|nr:cytochrome c3 family protein [Tepidisphaeraceae bacterium]
MSQIFHPAANAIAKGSIFGAVFILAAAAWVGAVLDTSPYLTETHVSRAQPVPFSHEHHVNGLGISCLYCHTSVKESAFAGIPPTKTCMTCHSQIWTNAAILQPVRDSWNMEKPLQWTRVHKLPDFVYFNHSIHVAKGIGCAVCHGPVDKMPLMYQENTLRMGWCLNCHRNPEQYIRPRDQVLNMNYDPATDDALDRELGVSQNQIDADKLRSQDRLGAFLVDKYHVHKEQLTNCAVCHR